MWPSRRSARQTVNSAVSALRFFFNVTLERPDLVRHLTSVQEPRKAPVVLNQEAWSGFSKLRRASSTRPCSALLTARAYAFPRSRP